MGFMSSNFDFASGATRVICSDPWPWQEMVAAAEGTMCEAQLGWSVDVLQQHVERS